MCDGCGNNKVTKGNMFLYIAITKKGRVYGEISESRENFDERAARGEGPSVPTSVRPEDLSTCYILDMEVQLPSDVQFLPWITADKR